MGLVTFTRIISVFGGTVSGQQERHELFKEALLLTLSRATNSDENIQPVEVEAVQGLMQSVAGEEVSAADVRVAAASELYESASLTDYLSAVGRKLTPEDRHKIVSSLASVIRSDRKVSETEIDFFNRVATALHASPAELVGLLQRG